MENKDEQFNIPKTVESKLDRKIHNQKNHPIEIIKNQIISYFNSLEKYNFKVFDNLSPFVSLEDNFDKLLIPQDHPSRSKSDTYYLNKDTVLRSHTSAHQNQLLAQGEDAFIVVGDVYRKDEVNNTHYPIFHQMEIIAKVKDDESADSELKAVINGLIKSLFPGCKYNIRDHHFHFTEPSYECDVFYNDDWLEVLGCGIMHSNIVKNNNRDGEYIAIGLGLDRLCMIFCEIEDIRQLWSQDAKFLDQYSNGKLNKFVPYSVLDPLHKDISFFIPGKKIIDSKSELGKDIKVWEDENEFYEIIREANEENIQEVKLMDEFFHKKKNMLSRMYRIVYSPLDPNLKDPGEFNQLCNDLQNIVREKVANLDLEMR